MSKPSVLQKMYELRRVMLPPLGERAVPVVVMAAMLATALMAVLLSLAWVQKSDIEYLRGSSGVVMLEAAETTQWSLSLPGASANTVTLAELGETSVKELHGEPFELALTLDAKTMQTFMVAAGDASVVLSLPAIEFEKATVSTTWLPERILARGEPAVLIFNDKLTRGVERFELKLKVWPHNTQERIVRSTVNMVPAFVAVQTRYQKYQDFLAGRRTGSGKQLADIGRIVLAVFAVFLFIFIDSSPECLALGMFMSLKALAVAVAQGWLPDSMFAPTTLVYTRNFMLSFADFMQLYFFTQLARLWRPRPFLWIAAGMAFGTLYTIGTSIVPEPGGINWPFQVWKWRNIAIGVGCVAAALPVALVCLRGKLYHRTTALLVATSGVIVQIVTPLIVDIPGVTESNWYKTWYNLFEMHTPYVFALSTFINVSTLERRVKTLSGAAIRKDAIERELTLGKAVQDAFFQIPEMPVGVNMTYAHNAAEFVSGDILYSHWDPVHNTVTMMLCDVTGHGVQAALKASICSAMSASIWEDGRLRPGDDPAKRLEIFYNRVTAYLTKTSGSAEILAMVGCELELETGVLRVFRANGIYPLIVRQEGAKWVVKTRAHAAKTFDVITPGDAGFVVISSDGVIAGPRVLKHVIEHLEKTLGASAEVTAGLIERTILTCEALQETGDDKTLAVIDVRGAIAGRVVVAA